MNSGDSHRSEDLVAIEKQRLEIERMRVHSEFSEREQRRTDQERLMQIRNFLADTILLFEEIKKQYP